MELWELELKMESSFMTPWHADVIFGHLAWTYREQYGEARLHYWLDEFNSGNPPFVLSDGYIKHGFPRPFLPPPKKQVGSKQEMIQQIKFAKKMKNRHVIHEDDFKKFLKGEIITLDQKVNGTFQNDINIYNIIDRKTGSSLESDGIYELESFSLKDTDRICVFIRVKNQAVLKEVEHLLHIVSLTGYGKKKGIGFGQFQLVDAMPRHDLDQMKEHADAVIWLNHGVPKDDDPVEGWYKLDTKYGKVATTFIENGSPFKRPLTRLLPGAVFKADHIKGFYGKMVTDIYPLHSSVVQYGFGLALPVQLPEYLKCEVSVS